MAEVRWPQAERLGAKAAQCLAGLLVMLGGCERAKPPPAQDPAPSVSATSAAASAPRQPDCPSGMALVEDFCIDRYEAQLTHHDEPNTPHSPYHRPRADRRYRAVSTRGVYPQAYLTRFEAHQACRNAQKRLCRADEWHRACGGARGLTYPYGDRHTPERCNTGKPHVLIKLFGRNTPLSSVHHYNNPRVNQQPGFLAPTGSYAQCRNDYGLYDMVGNLHEWVADDVSNALTKRIPLPYGKHLMGSRGNGVFMGGYYSSRGEHGQGCLYITTNHRPDYHDYSIGFRCCADPNRTHER